jgi:archaellum biogenesis ATPase FlaH
MEKGKTYKFEMIVTTNENIDADDFMDFVEGLFDNGRFIVTVDVPDGD